MKKIAALFPALLIMLVLCGCNSTDYKKAQTLFAEEEYEEASVLFEQLGDYKDSEDMLTECTYQTANRLLEEKDYEQAQSMFEDLGTYKDSAERAAECIYQQAKAILEKKDAVNLKILDAITLFEEIEGYKDSEDLLKQCYYQFGYQTYLSANSAAACEIALDYLEKAAEIENAAETIRNAKFKLVCHYVLENGEDYHCLLTDSDYKALSVPSELTNSNVYLLCDDSLSIVLFYDQTLTEGWAGCNELWIGIPIGGESAHFSAMCYWYLIEYQVGKGTVDITNIRSEKDFVFSEYYEEITDFSGKTKKSTSLNNASNLDFVVRKYKSILTGVESILAEQTPYSFTLEDFTALHVIS